jgi:hypothetical protein
MPPYISGGGAGIDMPTRVWITGAFAMSCATRMASAVMSSTSTNFHMTASEGLGAPMRA